LPKTFLTLLLLLATTLTNAQTPPPTALPIRAVIITTFPIESKLWEEREHLDETLPFPGGVLPLRTNRDHTVLSMVSGTTLVNATASLMALGLDPL
jgi:purine nucleoside permease